MNRVLGPVVQRSTVQDGVYQQLRGALMAGGFDPGQTLTIASLAVTAWKAGRLRTWTVARLHPALSI